jgi:tetratricopeptide (TPR) repeat protein
VVFGGLLSLWLVLGVPTSQAQSPPPAASEVASAKAHFEKGQRLFSVSRYREALEEFKEGFVAKSDPVFLYNIAQCHRLLGEKGEALTFYRRFLATKPQGRIRDEVNRRVSELEAEGVASPSVTPPVPAAPATAHPDPLPPAAPPSPPPAGDIALTSPGPAPAETVPLYKRWWVWAGAAAIVAAGVTTTLLMKREQPAKCPGTVDFCRQL